MRKADNNLDMSENPTYIVSLLAGIGVMTISDEDLAAAINDELDDIAAEAKLRGEGGKPGWEPEIDSHSVLRVCLRIEEEIGLGISEECVPVGGFRDRESCVATMMKHAKEAMAKATKVKNKTEAK